MDFQSQRHTNATVIVLSGRMDAVTTPLYESQMRALLDEQVSHLVVDLGGIDYISSAGLRGLLITAKLIKGHGRDLRVVNVVGNVLSVFQISGFHTMFKIDDSLEAALASLT